MLCSLQTEWNKDIIGADVSGAGEVLLMGRWPNSLICNVTRDKNLQPCMSALEDHMTMSS